MILRPTKQVVVQKARSIPQFKVPHAMAIIHQTGFVTVLYLSRLSQTLRSTRSKISQTQLLQMLLHHHYIRISRHYKKPVRLLVGLS